MNTQDIKLLEDAGWTVVCESPFEIEMYEEDSNGVNLCLGTASGAAADFILTVLKY